MQAKWLNWEYWPSAIIYFPVLPYLLYLMIRYRSVFFFNDANPGIENGGFTMESKWKIQEAVNHANFPKTAIVSKASSRTHLLEKVEHFQFPLVLKPDIGGKGRGVLVVSSIEEVLWYHQFCPMDYLIQEKISYENEVGIFYTRFPQESSGKITGIVFKSPVKVIGNGRSSVVDLLEKDNRYQLYLSNITSRIDQDLLRSIPEKGAKITLMDIGNHAQGSAFTDSSDQITPELQWQIDKIASQLNGFYFGRLDIRFSSWEELAKGKSFSIIEINGSGSEPTHIYDPKHSLIFAWKEIRRHWKILAEISFINRNLNPSKMTFSEGISLLLRHRKTMKLLDKLNSSLHFSNP